MRHETFRILCVVAGMVPF